jgi:transketolase
VLNPEVTQPDVILMATGSEVSLIVDAEKELAKHGTKARMVSFPCWELFAEQTGEYRESVLPKSVKKRLAVEAGVTLGWERWVGDAGDVVGLDRFGASAPGPRLMKELGFTVENVVARAAKLS